MSCSRTVSKKRMFCSITLLYTVLLSFVCGDVCDRTPSDTQASKTQGDNGFRIKLAGRPPPEKYTPDHVYTGL